MIRTLSKVCLLSALVLASGAEARGFLGIGDGKPGVAGIGDKKPGALGVGDKEEGVMGVGDGKRGALGINEDGDRRPECCRKKMTKKQRAAHERAHARAKKEKGELKPGVAESDTLKQDIIVFAKGKLAGFKVPRTIDFVDDLPRNPAGKVERKKVRAQYWEGRKVQI